MILDSGLLIGPPCIYTYRVSKNFRKRLQACVFKDSGHFEHSM